LRFVNDESLPLQPFVDRRKDLDGDPGLHALIVGVSHYQFLPAADASPEDIERAHGLVGLTSPARSAVNVWQWLQKRADKLTARLATCRLLLSPSPIEIEQVPQLKDFPETATFEAFRAAVDGWRQHALARPDDVTLLYFAGHGVEELRSGEQVLLLEDIAAPGPFLRNGVRTSEILAGMAPSEEERPNIARTQFYFLDSCRNTPDQFDQYVLQRVGSIWDVKGTKTIDDRACPIFFAAVPRGASYAGLDHQTLFSRALLACLKGDAGMPLDEGDVEAGWGVSVESLARSLRDRIVDLNRGAGANQSYVVNRYNGGRPVILHYLDAPPPVDITVTVAPEAAVPVTTVTVLDDWESPLLRLSTGTRDYPFRDRLAAGDYRVVATVDPAIKIYSTKRGTLKARPPRFPYRLRVGPGN
jgi:hypothetical protein